MTLKYLYTSLEKKTGSSLSTKEKSILNSMFADMDNIDAIIYASSDFILNSLLKEQNGFIIHENGKASKLPPKKDEIFFGVLIRPNSFLIAKAIS